MARNVLKSNNSILFISPSPAFTTGDVDSILCAGVVDSSFEFSLDRQAVKQIGSQNYVYNNINRHPDIKFENEYIFGAQLLNERVLGFQVSESSPYAVSGLANRSYNFCYINHPNQGYDALDNYVTSGANFSGYEAIAIGNAYLTRYSVGYAINSLPTVKTSFEASNIKYETMTGNSIESPAINLSSGNNNQVGDIQFTGWYDVPSRLSPAASPSYNIEASLQNLQVGGQNLSGYHFIQSLNMDLDFKRTPLYGLGSDYVYDRKLEYPIEGSISVSSLVSGFDAGQASGLLNNESGYYFEIGFTDKTKNYSGKFIIEDAKLRSYSYNMTVNQSMSFDASFSFEINENKGLKISGYNIPDDAGLLWNTAMEVWYYMGEIWSEA